MSGGLKLTTDAADDDEAQQPAEETRRRTVAPKNEALLQSQSDELYKEYMQGGWAHPSPVEAGGLMMRMPLPAQFLTQMRDGSTKFWPTKLREKIQAELPAAEEGAGMDSKALLAKWTANTVYCYRVAETMMEERIGGIGAQARCCLSTPLAPCCLSTPLAQCYLSTLLAPSASTLARRIPIPNPHRHPRPLPHTHTRLLFELHTTHTKAPPTDHPPPIGAQADSAGRINAKDLKPEELELLQLFSESQNAWQQVCLVLSAGDADADADTNADADSDADASRASASASASASAGDAASAAGASVVLNRPLAKGIDRQAACEECPYGLSL